MNIIEESGAPVNLFFQKNWRRENFALQRPCRRGKPGNLPLLSEVRPSVSREGNPVQAAGGFFARFLISGSLSEDFLLLRLSQGGFSLPRVWTAAVFTGISSGKEDSGKEFSYSVRKEQKNVHSSCYNKGEMKFEGDSDSKEAKERLRCVQPLGKSCSRS